MAVWVLEDDCLAPSARLIVNYVGPNPFRVYKKTRALLREIFEVESKDLWERDFRWDESGDPRGFYVRVYVDKGMDDKSGVFCEVILEGKQPSDPTKEGKLKITINARLVTRWNLDTAFKQLPFYRGLIWIYMRSLYRDVRRNYLLRCNRMLEELWTEFRKFLNMPRP